ncbi:MAG: outer membrane beta-barrel protein [Bacteroidota bacterium]
MKKTLIVISFIFLSYQVSAQLKVGGGVTYGVTSGLAGITVKGAKKLNDQWSLSPEFNFFFSRGERLTGDFTRNAGSATEFYALNVDFHRWVNFGQPEDLKPYLLVGVNYAFPVYVTENTVGTPGRTFRIRDTDSGASFNLGVGGQYALGSRINAYAELKAMILGDADQLISTVGFLYTLQ